MFNLDTNILIFALIGELAPAERSLLASSRWSVSSIVLWEMAKLVQLGRLDMDLDDREVARVLGRLHVWPIDLAVARASTALDFRSDPADEIISATQRCPRHPAGHARQHHTQLQAGSPSPVDWGTSQSTATPPEPPHDPQNSRRRRNRRGVNGASIAMHLARLGAGKVLLVDRGHLAGGPTGRSGAMVRDHYLHPVLVRMSMESSEVFRNFADAVGGDAGSVRPAGSCSCPRPTRLRRARTSR